MAEISSDATPFPHRNGNLFKIQYFVNCFDPLLGAAKKLYSYMTPFVSKNPRSGFLNYRDLDIGVNSFGENSFQGEVYGTKYFNNNFQSLVRLIQIIFSGINRVFMYV